jgi:seryl-tRNA synthetase
MEDIMIDLKFLRENPELVKENIRKKYQDSKLPLVDEVIALDELRRSTQQEADKLRGDRKTLSKDIGNLMAAKKKAADKEAEEKIQAETEAKKREVAAGAERLAELEAREPELEKQVNDIMMVIPNIIDPTVPIGKDDTEIVEVTKYGEPVLPDFEIPYHTQIMERFCGIDLESAGKVAGNGFYYLMGDIARLHSAVLSYARDFMIGRGFTYCIPPYMIRSNVVTGVMSFAEMDAMMYKIEGEDLYLIGTSEHSMIGRFMDTILQEDKLPYALTSYSPCFRKEKGAHGIEERGVYRIHQFEKQEMIVVCKPEDSPAWFEKLWNNTVDFFRTLDIPVRTLECCSGDLADLKVKSYDVEAWSPRQKKYFEVGSCSNLGDAQARRLKIRINGDKGKYFAHTLNNTVVAPPRMLIAFLENNLNKDFSLRIPEALRPYMGGQDILRPIEISV